MWLYTGQVSHSRFKPSVHRFEYGISMAWLNLGKFDHEGPSLARLVFPIRCRDHLRNVPGEGDSLTTRLARLVRQRLGQELDKDGAIYLLTGFGFLWHRFNPVSFYFCLDARGETECLVAEVTNTPWHEQSYYVFDTRAERGDCELRFSCPKSFHVSPFMAMDSIYHWRIANDGDQLAINIAVEQGDRPLFNAHLDLVGKPVTALAFLAALARQPLMSLSVSLRIYWQAMRLWFKSTPFFQHPRYSSGDK